MLGEQVASPDGLGWLDLVSADLGGTGYALGAADLCSAGFGLAGEESQAGEWLRRAIRHCADPRIAAELRDFAFWAGGNLGDGGANVRQRLYWLGYALGAGLEGHAGDDARAGGRPVAPRSAAAASLSRGLADSGCPGLPQQFGRRFQSPGPAALGTAGELADAAGIGRGEERPDDRGGAFRDRAEGAPQDLAQAAAIAGPIRITAAGLALTGSYAAMEAGRQLDPGHSRWLMGLPPAWCDWAATATRSMRRSRRRS